MKKKTLLTEKLKKENPSLKKKVNDSENTTK